MKLFTVVLVLLVSVQAFAKDLDEMTGLQLAPMGGQSSELEQAVGFYARGSLKNQDQLPLSGDGFIKIMKNRNRAFATSDLVQLIEWAAAIMVEYHSGERMQIGDMSKSGGKKVGGHKSHQNGLDADIIYFRKNHKEADPSLHNGFVENFVRKGKVTKNFDTDRNWELIKLLVGTERVSRIFVDKAIKRHLCKYARKKGELAQHAEALRRLRPYPHHDDHMHLRISCPTTSPRCVKQKEPPMGSGC